MAFTVRYRYILLPFVIALLTLTLLFRLDASPYKLRPDPPPDEKPKLKPHPLYKPDPRPNPPPLAEYFPLASQAKSPADLPPIPSWNTPPNPHVPETTRLYIGFTRYWPLLQQVVVAYITQGWPPEDIYVIENTGTFDANKRGLLTSQNPFYMDYHRLTQIFGVNVVTMPSLQSFAQLQNFYLSDSISSNLSYYFWAHMDTVPTSHEEATPYRSLYQIAVDTIRESVAPGYAKDEKTGQDQRWAIRFFSYDWLALVNVKAYVEVGGWDTMISYYGTDCDMHNRIYMKGLQTPIADAGKVFDVGKSLPDLEVLYRRKRKPGAKKREEKITGSTGDTGVASVSVDKNGKMEAKPVAEDSNPKAQEEAKADQLSGKSGDHKTQVTGSTFSGEKQLVTVGEHGKVHFGTPANTTGLAIKDSSDLAPTPPSSPSTPASAALKIYLTDTLEDDRGSPAFHALQDTLETLAQEKRDDPYRNSWQLQQRGGQGEPFHYDADGWEKALQMTIEAGAKIMEEKWGHKGCNLREVGLGEGDGWRVEHDWD